MMNFSLSFNKKLGVTRKKIYFFYPLSKSVMKIFNIFCFICFSPVFILYLFLCFLIPIFKIGKVKKRKGKIFYITKDTIHADYVFESNSVSDLFPTDMPYTKIGWGDRKIFLETQKWSELKFVDFVFAFLGRNRTVLKVEFLKQIPENSKKIHADDEQLNIIKLHIQDSNNGKKIKKKETYFQKGNYYESDLRYNCIKNCNNWINSGLRSAQINNRFWCPLTFWI